MNIYFLLYLLFIVAPIGTIIHEVGHLIGAKIVKSDQISLSIGLGKRIGSFSFQNIQVNIHLLFFLGGCVNNRRDKPYQLLEMLCIIGAGPIHNAIYAIFFYLLSSVFYNQYIHILSLFNLWLAIINIIPFKMKDKQSDGYIMLSLLRKQKRF